MAPPPKSLAGQKHLTRFRITSQLDREYIWSTDGEIVFVDAYICHVLAKGLCPLKIL